MCQDAFLIPTLNEPRGSRMATKKHAALLLDMEGATLMALFRHDSTKRQKINSKMMINHKSGGRNY